MVSLRIAETLESRFETEPFCDPTHQAGASRTGGSPQGIYITVPRRGTGEDRAPGERGTWQRSHSGPARHATSDRQQVAPAVLYRSAARSERPTARRATSALFPPNVVVAIKALACELPSRHGLPLARWSVAELRQEAVACGIVAKTAAPRFGAGLVRTHYAPGAIAAGSFPATRTSPARRVASSICIDAAGKVQRWGHPITCSASMRRPPSRLGSANIRPCPRRRGARSTWSTSMHVSVRWLTSPRGTCTEPGCSAAASARTVSRRSTASSVRSWVGNRIGQRAMCS